MYIKKIHKLEDVDKLVKLSNIELQQLGEDIHQAIENIGINCGVELVNGTSLKINGCKLTDEYKSIYGSNLHIETFRDTKRRGSILGFLDWKQLLIVVNELLDEKRISADIVSSVKNKQREGLSWSTDMICSCRYDNVGSQMYPIHREDQWSSEGRGRMGWLYDKKWENKEREWINQLIDKVRNNNQNILQEELDCPLLVKHKNEFRDVCNNFKNNNSKQILDKITELESIKTRKRRKKLPIEVSTP